MKAQDNALEISYREHMERKQTVLSGGTLEDRISRVMFHTLLVETLNPDEQSQGIC